MRLVLAIECRKAKSPQSRVLRMLERARDSFALNVFNSIDDPPANARRCPTTHPFLDTRSAHGECPYLLIQPIGRLRFSATLRGFNLLPVRKMRNPQLIRVEELIKVL